MQHPLAVRPGACVQYNQTGVCHQDSHKYITLTAAEKVFFSVKIYPNPNHIRDNNYKSATKLNHKGYEYPHDYGGYVKQQYLPNELKNKKYYKPLTNGAEEKLNTWLKLFLEKK